MASNRPQDKREQDAKDDDGYFLCLEIIKEVIDLDVAIRSFVANKSAFTVAEIKQVNSAANDLLAGIRGHLPEFSKNLSDLKNEIATQEKEKIPKEFEQNKKVLVTKLKDLYKSTSEAYTKLEGLYKVTAKKHKDTEDKLEKALKARAAAAPSTLFSGKDQKTEAKESTASVRLKK